MAAKTIRLRELDFLRGIAIILVLFRHGVINTYTTNMGWIGVDLFFVLSGYLVSGLLFREYLKYGNIQAVRFLIRRGFKIYPIYYISYLLYLPALLDHLNIFNLIADLTFIQNYVSGWGYAYTASWSLAIEEHFYFALAIVLWVCFKRKILKLQPEDSKNPAKGLGRFETTIFAIMLLCFLLRIMSNLISPEKGSQNFTMTHLRIDSLLAGVLISYLFYFKRTYFQRAFQEKKKWLLIIALLGLCWTPFFNPVPSFFVMTIGFTLLYVSFSIILGFFILTPNINGILNRRLSKYAVSAVSKIGVASYSIYVVHTFVNININILQDIWPYLRNPWPTFFSTSLISIILGWLITFLIERFFLAVRDRYFPSRASQLKSINRES